MISIYKSINGVDECNYCVCQLLARSCMDQAYESRKLYSSANSIALQHLIFDKSI